MANMTKKDMAAKLATKASLSKQKAMEVINAIFSTDPREGIIAIELDADRKVVIPGFGTFGTKSRAARTGTNPATGEKIQIAAKKYVWFRPGKNLRERVEK